MFNELVTKEDLTFFTSGAYFILGAIQFQEKRKDIWVTYDLLIRGMPQNRNYLVFAGLENIIDYLTNFKLNKEQLDYLKRSYQFPPAVMAYYKKMRFRGDMWAMPEGTLFFPYEPVIRITAPIIDSQIIERYLENTFMAYSVLASKFSRFVHAVGKETKSGINFTRSHGIGAASIALRAAQIVGVQLATLPYSSLKYRLKPESGGTTHAFISSFPTEEQALRTYCKYCRGIGWWLVDTYDTKKGTEIYIKVVLELKKKGKPFPSHVILDSGNLAEDSKMVRKLLDQAGLKEAKIMLVSNLDEYKITKMNKQHPCVDIYVGGEELTTSPDAPKLGVVYKMAEIQQGGKVIPKMKLSIDKISYPGRKQVFRQFKNGKYCQDIIGLEKEKIAGKKLLVPIIEKGKLIYQLPFLDKINQYYRAECKKFNPSLFAINRQVKYPVKISPALRFLTKKTKLEIQKAHHEL